MEIKERLKVWLESEVGASATYMQDKYNIPKQNTEITCYGIWGDMLAVVVLLVVSRRGPLEEMGGSWARLKEKEEERHYVFWEWKKKKSLFWDVGKESMGFVVSPSVNWKWNQSVSCKPAYNVAIGCQNFTHNPILNFWRDPNIIINK